MTARYLTIFIFCKISLGELKTPAVKKLNEELPDNKLSKFQESGSFYMVKNSPLDFFPEQHTGPIIKNQAA